MDLKVEKHNNDHFKLVFGDSFLVTKKTCEHKGAVELFAQEVVRYLAPKMNAERDRLTTENAELWESLALVRRRAKEDSVSLSEKLSAAKAENEELRRRLDNIVALGRDGKTHSFSTVEAMANGKFPRGPADVVLLPLEEAAQVKTLTDHLRKADATMKALREVVGECRFTLHCLNCDDLYQDEDSPGGACPDCGGAFTSDSQKLRDVHNILYPKETSNVPKLPELQQANPRDRAWPQEALQRPLPAASPVSQQPGGDQRVSSEVGCEEARADQRRG